MKGVSPVSATKASDAMLGAVKSPRPKLSPPTMPNPPEESPNGLKEKESSKEEEEQTTTMSTNVSADEHSVEEPTSTETEVSEEEKKAQKMKKQLDSVVNEIVQSERSFCKDLEILIQVKFPARFTRFCIKSFSDFSQFYI